MMVNSTLLKGKVCLVTGANKGIGRAIVENFAMNGATIYANAREDNSLDYCESLGKEYDTAVLPIYFDVTDFEKVKQSILKIKKEQGQLDVLINNAGIVSYEILGMVDFDFFRKMFEVNVIAVVNLMELAAKLMRRQKSGSIINMSSVVGEKGSFGQLSYSGTKGAVSSITKSAAKDLVPFNIRVNSIAPGMIGTERLKSVMKGKFEEKLNDIGLGRLGYPQEVANACLFLASDMSSYITGQIIEVDGSLKL